MLGTHKRYEISWAIATAPRYRRSENSNYINLTQGRGENNSITSVFDKDIYKFQEFENLVINHGIWNGKNEWNYKRLKSRIEEILILCEQEISLLK